MISIYQSKDHRWRDSLNPLRGLSMPRLVSLLEAGDCSHYAFTCVYSSTSRFRCFHHRSHKKISSPIFGDHFEHTLFGDTFI